MKAIVTGASGTVGTELCKHLSLHGYEAIRWNRDEISFGYDDMKHFIEKSGATSLFHLAYTFDPQQSWFINYEWTSELAWITKILGVKFIFTSTNAVFKNSQQGSFTLQSVPDADEGYGFEKRKAEERIFFQNENAIIARLGWQIGNSVGSNNMIDYFEQKMKTDRTIHVNTNWIPACSFLNDTCEKMIDIAENFSPGLYMLDSNEQWNLFEIATVLNKKFNFNWRIQPLEDVAMDSRMSDDRVKMISLKEKLPLL